MSHRRMTIVFLFSFISICNGMVASGEAQEASANKAARIRIIKFSLNNELAGQKAPAGKAYVLVQTEWENIHPKAKMEKKVLKEGPDGTMGVGDLMRGKKEVEGAKEYVDLDVAYKVPSLLAHAYCLADGQSIPLDRLTEKIPGGTKPDDQFEFFIAKLGEKKQVSLVYLIPGAARNLAFQFFDYEYGNILLPLSGDLKLARGSGEVPGKALGSVKDRLIELAVTAVDFRSTLDDEEAPEGWRNAIVELKGKSLSQAESVKDIVQINPVENIWLQTKEGYLYYCRSAATPTEEGLIRFTPEVYQSQQLRFLVPTKCQDLTLGIRIQNTVYSLALSPSFSLQMPKPAASHRDGKIMEIMLFGARREGNKNYP